MKTVMPKWKRPPPSNEELTEWMACRRHARWVGAVVRRAFMQALARHGLVPDPVLTIRVRGVPFPIEFADWTHDRLYVRHPLIR